MSLIEVEALSKSYQMGVEEVHALRGVDLTVEKGDYIAIMGPSGSGKSTLLNLLGCLDTPTSGRYVLNSRDVSSMAEDDLAQVRNEEIGFVFQTFNLLARATALQNVELPLVYAGVGADERRVRARQALEKVDLLDRITHRPNELSGGQRQRVALARAIVRTPTVFLMDEPLSNLDAKLRVSMRAELKHLQHELRITTVYVTHDQIEAMTLADRVAVMDHGIISQLDTPENIYNDPTNLFVAGFIGSPAMNLIPGTLQQGQFQHPRLSILTGLGDCQQATLGVCPEDLELTQSENGTCSGSVYSFELTGESTLVTVQLGDDLLTVRGPKEFRIGIDEAVGVRLVSEKCYLFDSATKQRLRV